jgi:hypothetical protein
MRRFPWSSARNAKATTLLNDSAREPEGTSKQAAAIQRDENPSLVTKALISTAMPLPSKTAAVAYLKIRAPLGYGRRTGTRLLLATRPAYDRCPPPRNWASKFTV